MIKVNIHEAKAHFSEYLAKVEKGEYLVICKRNMPIAEIRPIPHASTEERPIGLAKGKIKISKDFFKKLPKNILDSFYGDES